MPDPSLARTFLDTGADYERYRPGFPETVADRIIESVGAAKGSRVPAALDLGAGTGKFARLLAPRAGALYAVDPSERMLAELRRHLPGVDVRVGSAESIPMPDGSVDVVTVAQAFHWFDEQAACAEIARVLRKGGVLALIWNISDPACRWDVDCMAIAHGRSPEDPPDPDDEYDPAAPPIPPIAPGFTPFHAGRTTWAEPLSREHYLRRWMTVSRLLAAPAGERAAMLDRMERILDDAPETTGRAILPLTNVTELFLYRAERSAGPIPSTHV